MVPADSGPAGIPEQTSELCTSTIIRVFREDLTGVPSLEIVRMLNRMIKERRFAIHPNVLSCLSHLRLRTELGVRASDTRAEKEGEHDSQQLRKGKKANQPHLSKKSKKAFKEKKNIEKEMREAEAEVDKEERAATVSQQFSSSALITALVFFLSLTFRYCSNFNPKESLMTKDSKQKR